MRGRRDRAGSNIQHRLHPLGNGKGMRLAQRIEAAAFQVVHASSTD
jgi:hypothetical protein